MLDTISTVKMSHEEWLEERRKSIGGSDAAAVIGMSRFASPYTVWMDKTGRLPEKEDTEAMRIGRDLEEYVAKRFEEASGKKVRRCNYIIRNPAYPWAHADIDRRISSENAGLECKTTSTLDIRQFNGVEFPERYYAQCVHYLAVTGLDRWYLAVLVFGRGFFTYTLERDEAEISALMEAEKLFWRCVEEDTPPAPDGSEATTDAISTVYADSNGEQLSICRSNVRRRHWRSAAARLKTRSSSIWVRQSGPPATATTSLGSSKTGRRSSPKPLKRHTRISIWHRSIKRCRPGHSKSQK